LEFLINAPGLDRACDTSGNVKRIYFDNYTAEGGVRANNTALDTIHYYV
jgi:hypothetical protein